MSRVGYRVSHLVVAPFARLLWRPTVTGSEHVPRTGGVILASNHLSFVDSVAIPIVAPRPVSFLAKSDYFTGSGPLGAVRRGFFEMIEAIPVDRHSSRAAQESLDAALAVLRAGRAFGIYPEGTRSRDGRLYKGRTGVAWLALTAGVPVVPVGLVGTDAVQPVGARFPRPARVRVTFGPPVSPEPYAELPAGKARRQLTDAVMDAIAGLTGQERADCYNELPPDSQGAAVGI
ncbi:1-acyl-sn-glycerol-3-phosphate acyltransferase [Phycicoccus endophyticus]|uniref:1-acyl-sn-glycerol-3-phosphate acyltransferase n=1 Tax=Phycicoccus endophyticus TaxID=1690220 RepID=A0A7G9R029_9MICO|nr:lysophospholipid acyltransferase family protein [Phycicoccus endophyticus]NHI20819.1 1-acyl-sn-glycerol-3-phosphate acyltransferase [Phycicoccus endophyticus]QNN48954.1 1-acyl-sn-glycerol-3-phosphate acyltransferase [Phycicoccus endophyticus]GGL44210.1 1-acyl-sn-glycerol-3-phosphate acyltransferase [Phycicoccus endophyticus]